MLLKAKARQSLTLFYRNLTLIVFTHFNWRRRSPTRRPIQCCLISTHCIILPHNDKFPGLDNRLLLSGLTLHRKLHPLLPVCIQRLKGKEINTLLARACSCQLLLHRCLIRPLLPAGADVERRGHLNQFDGRPILSSMRAFN
uniref:Uncharacterized protein n=1 Tax=Hydatigena taeniaeformis TaxID=6205 RepID=A0A0R3WSP7_HYDTA